MSTNETPLVTEVAEHNPPDGFDSVVEQPQSLLDQIEAKIERDYWDRYVLPHPDTGKKMSWTRATTHAKLAADMFKLSQWQQRMVAKGLAISPGLLALAASTPLTDRDGLQAVCERAKEAAAARDRGDVGTALHAFTEQHDLGQEVTAPAPYDADVQAWAAALAEHQITILPTMVERVCIVPELGVAGTFDRIATSPRWELPRILDLKSGRDLSYGQLEIECQLSLYSRAKLAWNLDEQCYERMPEMDQKFGVVVHVPAGEGRAEVLGVDLEFGWEVAQHSARTRFLRNAAKRHMWPMAKMPVPIGENGDRVVEQGEPTYEQRVEATHATAGLAGEQDDDTDPTLNLVQGLAEFTRPVDDPETMITSARTVHELIKVGKQLVEQDRMTPELKELGKRRRKELIGAGS